MTETAPPSAFRLPAILRGALFVAPALLIAGVIWAGIAVWPKLPGEPSGPYSKSGLAPGTSLPDADGENPDGYKLFQFHCANCHGVRGDGVGLAGLNPRARAAAIITALSALPRPVAWRLMVPTGTP